VLFEQRSAAELRVLRSPTRNGKPCHCWLQHWQGLGVKGQPQKKN